MIETNKKLMDEFNQGMKEFDAAATLLAEALRAFHERLERVEEWILRQENQESRQTRTPTTDVVRQ